MNTPAVIMEQFQRLVGEANTIPFLDDRASVQRAVLGDWAYETAPTAVVLPADAAQVQAVVKTAATLGVGISVIPNAAGNGVSITGGNRASIVLDLRRMDRILEFNSDSGYALLEPGVNFDQLRAFIESEDGGYWIDTDTNGANSVSGSVTERAFGYTPYGDHLLMQCGMEVVTANGEVTRTGMGALPGSDTWQLFKYNFGPYLDGLFSRSDFAIVTKLGLWLMPAPPAFHPFMVTLSGTAALEAAIEVLRPLKIGMVVPNTVLISHASADAELLEAAGDPRAADFARDRGLDEWTLFGALYGIPDNVALTWDMLNQALSAIPSGAIFTTADAPAHPLWPLRTQLMRGVAAYSAQANGSETKLWFAASAPMEGAAATEMRQILADTLAAQDISYSYEFALTWRTMFMRVTIPYTNDDFAARREASLELIGRLAAAGFATSHDCPELTAAVSRAETGASLRKLQAALGQALDPQGIFGSRDG